MALFCTLFVYVVVVFFVVVFFVIALTNTVQVFTIIELSSGHFVDHSF